MGALIVYYLSEEGRKVSLLNGGDGKWEQHLFTEDPELISRMLNLEKTKVDYGGGVSLYMENVITGVRFKRQSYYAIKKQIKEQLQKFNGYILEEINIVIPEYIRAKTFDKPMKIEELIGIAEQEAKVLEDAEKRKKEIEREITSSEEYRDIVQRTKAELEEQALKKRKDAEFELMLEREKRERELWIEDYGSEYLKDCLKLGYDCQRKYAKERAAKELPEFILDIDRQLEYEPIKCPSKEALELAKEYLARGFKVKIVLLTKPFQFNLPDAIYSCPEAFGKSHEGVLIMDYLGRYTLLHRQYK